MYEVYFFNEGMVVSFPDGRLRFVVDERRPYMYSLNLRVYKGRVIYITDCGVGQSTLPVATQLEQDKYAWLMKSGCQIDQEMPWSNAVAYGVAHNHISWVETDLTLVSHSSGMTLSDIKLWIHHGESFMQSLGVNELFDEPTQMNAQAQATPNAVNHINNALDNALKCYEEIDNKPPVCVRKLNLH